MSETAIKRNTSIGLETREVWPDKFLPYISSYGEYFFVRSACIDKCCCKFPMTKSFVQVCYFNGFSCNNYKVKVDTDM